MFPGTWLTPVIVNVLPPTGAGAHGKVPTPSTYSRAKARRRHFPKNGWSGRDTHPSYLKGPDGIVKLGRPDPLKLLTQLCVVTTTAAVSSSIEVLISSLQGSSGA